VTGLESAANGVIDNEVDKSSCVIPGVSFVNNGLIAYLIYLEEEKKVDKERREKRFTSGVISLGEKPVPPVRIIRFNESTSDHCWTVLVMAMT
jgi:hypothetical protein